MTLNLFFVLKSNNISEPLQSVMDIFLDFKIGIRGKISHEFKFSSMTKSILPCASKI